MSLLNLLRESPIAGIVFFLSIVLAISVHEFAHAWSANKLGDDTPRLQGRLTLSPLAHLDPMGTLAMILFGFGWGRPVEVNPMRFKKGYYDLLVSLSGPISNLLTAMVINALIVLVGVLNINIILPDFLIIAAYVNIALGAFNLLPIPPLDGSSIVSYFWPEYRSIVGSRVGLIIILVLVFLPLPGVGNLLGTIMSPLMSGFYHLSTLFGLLSAGYTL